MSNLEKIGVEFRKQNITKNAYNENDKYNVGHSNALSNGDEKGKGELDGEAGGLTDVKARQTAEAKNKYNSNRQYDAGTVDK